MMSKRQVLAALARAPRVFVWVHWLAGDGTYFRVPKADARYRLQADFPSDIGDDDEAIVARTDEDSGALYIG